MSEHPAVAVYGNTEVQHFPLVLFFGREYNNEGQVALRLGPYDFNESSGSAFWNRSYGLLCRLSQRDLKTTAIARQCSPVVFTNAIPRPIPTRIPKKDCMRAEVTDAELMAYIAWIFSCNLITRVRCVTISGLRGIPFQNAANAIKKESRDRGLHLIDIPYLGSRKSNHSIDSALITEDISVLKAILQEFYSWADESQVLGV